MRRTCLCFPSFTTIRIGLICNDPAGNSYPMVELLGLAASCLRAPLARRRERDTLGYVGERAGGGSGQKEGARASIRLGLRKKIKVREMSPFSQERRVYASEAWTDRRSGNFRRN